MVTHQTPAAFFQYPCYIPASCPESTKPGNPSDLRLKTTCFMAATPLRDTAV